MLAWRLCRRPYADLTGEGARLYGGRWNSKGRAVVYLAEHPALAALEVRVHLDLPFDLVPDDYVLMGVDVPGNAIMDAVPGDSTVAVGDAWLAAGSSAALRVPSVLMPHAWNILLNPRYGSVRVEVIEPFRFDPRLWTPLGTEG